MENWRQIAGSVDLNIVNFTDVYVSKDGKGNTVVVLICDSSAKAHKLKLLIDNNEFIFQVIQRDNKDVLVEIEFIKSGQTIEYLTNKKPFEYFDFKWLLEQTADYLTVGTKNSENEIKWHDHYISLYRTGEAAKRLGFN